MEIKTRRMDMQTATVVSQPRALEQRHAGNNNHPSCFARSCDARGRSLDVQSSRVNMYPLSNRATPRIRKQFPQPAPRNIQTACSSEANHRTERVNSGNMGHVKCRFPTAKSASDTWTSGSAVHFHVEKCVKLFPSPTELTCELYPLSNHPKY